MSQTFTLTSHTSELHTYFYPPIELDPEYEYAVALIGFYTYNSIPNIENGTNKFYYYENNNKKSITIPTGSYEISDIESYIQNYLAKLTNAKNKEDIFILKANNNTLKCELKCAYRVDFTPDDCIGNILGFSKKELHENILHDSDLPVNIIKVTTIRIECNIIKGSYYNSATSHTIYEFAPTVDPGYSINIQPKNLVFLPINTTTIDNITIRVLDQKGRLINFRGEEIIVRLELKKHGLSF